MKQAIYTPMTTKKFRQRTADMLGKKQNQATKIRLNDASQRAKSLMSRMQDVEAEMMTPIKSQADYVTQSLDSWHSSIMEREPFENPKISLSISNKSSTRIGSWPVSTRCSLQNSSFRTSTLALAASST